VLLVVVRVGSSYEQYQNMRANAYCSVVMYVDRRVGSSHKGGQKIAGKTSHSVAGYLAGSILQYAPATLYPSLSTSHPAQHDVSARHSHPEASVAAWHRHPSCPAVPCSVDCLLDIRTAPSSLSSLLFETAGVPSIRRYFHSSPDSLSSHGFDSHLGHA